MDSSISTSLTIRTYAKINLLLQVAPPVTDPALPGFGLHPICSWMHAIDLFDEIRFEESGDDQTEFDIRWSDGSPVEWETASDLMVRAHALLESVVDRPLPVRVTARKSIPAGGGLGGGSSNGAGVLMGLNDLFQLGLDESTLQSIAFKLGSDIPFFIDLPSHRAGLPPQPAVVSGFGDQIQRTPRRADRGVLLIPRYGCPTGAVYNALDARRWDRTLDPDRVLRAATAVGIDPGALTNDLTDPAVDAQPELSGDLARLTRAGIHARLSGSGSTLFVLGDAASDAVLASRAVLEDRFTIRPIVLA